MLQLYSHPDGGTYVILNDHRVQMKMDNKRWEHAVIFTRVSRGPTGKWQYEGKNQLVVTKQQWDERFTALEDEGC